MEDISETWSFLGFVWLAGMEEMEKMMENTIVGCKRTTIGTHSFMPC